MEDSISSEQQMLENVRNNTLRSSGSPVKYFKKKNRGKKRKTLCYVDYDQTPGEEDVMQNAASLTWPGTVAASSFQLESESESKHCNRESVTYEDDDPPSSSRAADPLIVRGKCYNYQFDINHAPAPGNWMHTAMSTQPKNFRAFSKEHAVSSSCSPQLLAYVDPTVVASEKKEIFKKPDPPQGNTGAKIRKPLTASQKRRMQKAKYYKELEKKQADKAKERAETEKVLRPCKYYQSGNCNKGKKCIFSHDCEVIKKPDLCKFYLLSTCTKGLACPYYHGDWPCKFFHVYKFCMNGDTCKFSHEPLTDESRQLLDKAMSNSDTSATGKTGRQLSSDVAKENCQSSGNSQQAVNYNVPFVPQYMMSGSQAVSSMNIFHPHQLNSSCRPPGNAPTLTMTLQQKVYRLNPIEFEKPVKRELPAYVDVNDPRWSADPRVRPCVQPTVTAISECTNTNGLGLAFYSSVDGHSVSDALSVAQQPSVSGTDAAASSYVPLISANEAAMHDDSVHDCSSATSYPVNSISNHNSSTICESTPSLPVKQENLSDVVIKSEPFDVTDTASAPVARHAFQHNVSWLSVTRSSGIQKLSQAKNGSN